MFKTSCYSLAILVTFNSTTSLLADNHKLTSSPIKTDKPMQDIQPGKPIADKKELADRKTTEDILINRYGFKQVQFKAEDGVELKGLLYTRPQAQRTIAICAGFFPGIKEGMASFLHLFPQDSNFLLFDARGHGESKGKFWSYLGNYGLQEYKDVIGATTFLNNEVRSKTQAKKNYVFAYCMGGLHAAHAHIQLSKRKQLTEHSDGFICDSAAQSLRDLEPMFITHILSQSLPRALGYRPSTINKTWWYYWLKLGIGIPFVTAQEVIVNLQIRANHAAIRTDDKIASVSAPILFIHAEKDNYISSKGTRTLAANAKAKLWLLPEETDHFAHHLNEKWKDSYLQKIREFIQECEQQKQ